MDQVSHNLAARDGTPTRPAGTTPQPAGTVAVNSAVAARRTFAIISHPDAGKTTLTEKLLAAAGAVHLAGQVRARGEGRRTRSDWMAIEQQRGISISSSVMTFEYRGLTFNLLDTPGHSDFSEDTYRTLTAVDSAVMVIDAAKGIESQTLKLFEVCRLRDIPIITFVNKVDRDGLGPLAIIDDIAEKLALDVTPVLWPLGDGIGFRGCLDLRTNSIITANGGRVASSEVAALLDSGIVRDERSYTEALEQLELARATLPPLDLEIYRAGHLTPILFGSALNNIGVTELLDAIAEWAPSPRPQPAEPAPIEPADPETVGFVFKVQANMDPKHRDRIAFVRLCSGTFERGDKLRNVRTGKDIAVTAPMFFFAQERQLAEEAVAGDVIGIPNHGTLSVGDTLTGGSVRKVTGIPNFAPELIRRIRIPDAMRAKQLAKALSDLAEEGVAQIFRPNDGSDWLVGVVGPLQLEVLSSRLDTEYGVKVILEDAGIDSARWPTSTNAIDLKNFLAEERRSIVLDRFGSPVILIRDRWSFARIEKAWPAITFARTKERG